tara:strand:- start:236 stop:427 length:192 start_codon:yes stop_codon:yes gene_type:complete
MAGQLPHFSSKPSRFEWLKVHCRRKKRSWSIWINLQRKSAADSLLPEIGLAGLFETGVISLAS